MKLKAKITDVSLDFVSHKPKITLQITNQQDILTDEFNQLQNEELLEITITKYSEKRGLQANKYFHKLVNELAKYNRGRGFAISDDEMKIQLNLSYGTVATDENGKVFGAKIPKGKDITSFYPYAKKYKTDSDGDCYIFYKRTSELNSKEFWQLIKGVEVECEKVGIPTLEDIELERMMKDYDKCFK